MCYFRQKNYYIKELEEENKITSTMKGLFKKAADFESIFQKELSEFNVDEIEVYLKALKSKSINSLSVHVSNLAKYSDWCYEHGYKLTGENYFRGFPKDIRDNCVCYNEYIEKLCSKEEIILMSEMLRNNPVNQYIFLAPWYGVGAKERKHLKICSSNNIVYSENEIFLVIDDVCLKIDEFFADIVRRATETFVYYGVDGRSAPLQGSSAWKIVNRSNTYDTKFEVQLNSKYYRISDLVEREINYNIIQKSAMLHLITTNAAEKGMTQLEYIFSDDIFSILDTYYYRTTINQLQRKANIRYDLNDYLD